MVSYAYSYSLGNKTGVYNNGTHEIILRYNLRQVAKALIDSPRYFKMKKLFNFILLFSVIYSKANLLAQGEQFTEFDIYELKISDKETAYSPMVLKVGESQIELIIVTSQKNENINKIKRKFKDVEVDKIFNLQKITIDNKPPFEIISKVSLPSTINTSYQEGLGYTVQEQKIIFHP